MQVWNSVRVALCDTSKLTSRRGELACLRAARRLVGRRQIADQHPLRSDEPLGNRRNRD